jgi:hypothetical protein
MRMVTVRLAAEGFSAGMAAMREWLDRNGYAAQRFDCAQNGDEVALSVDFTSDQAADAFEKSFTGSDSHSLYPAPSNALLITQGTLTCKGSDLI